MSVVDIAHRDGGRAGIVVCLIDIQWTKCYDSEKGKLRHATYQLGWNEHIQAGAKLQTGEWAQRVFVCLAIAKKNSCAKSMAI